jgi:hypothetical protein
MRSVRGTLAGVAMTVLVPVALLTACGAAEPPADGAAATSDSAAVSTTTAPTPTPTTATTPSAPAVTASATPSATASASATVDARPRWAKPLGEPQQGDPVWAVYLAVGHSATDAPVEQAVRDAAKVGYQAVVGDIACDGGAMQALALDVYDYWSGATLYFATEGDARGFAAAYTGAVHAPVGVAQVSVGCLD